MNKERAKKVCAHIREAFAGVAFPGENHRSIKQAVAWDDYETVDQSEDHKGRWEDLEADDIQNAYWGLNHLDAAGYQYYFPALVILVLERGDPTGLVEDALLFTLDRQDLTKEFTDEQWEAAIEFSDYQRELINSKNGQ